MAVDTRKGIKGIYQEILERIELLLLNSSLEHVEHSSEVIEGGVYAWGQADVLKDAYRMALIEEYLILVTRMRLDLEEKDSKALASFDHSCNIVLTYLKQETFVYENTTDDVLKTIEKELAIQYFLMNMPVENLK